MSRGGVFRLITRDGAQDKLLYATDLLKKRIDVYISNRREKINNMEKSSKILESTLLPDLNFIDKSHTMFISGGFKPHVAVAYDYGKVRFNAPKFDQEIEFNLPHYGNFLNDMMIHVRINTLKVSDSKDRVRYVSRLGHKFFQCIKFSIGGNMLDEITTDDYNAFYNFHLVNGHTEWLRAMGEEDINTAFLTGDPLFDLYREYKYIGKGNQTLKQRHETVDLFIPLLFWTRDIRQALPLDLIPHGQTTIKAKISPVTGLVGAADYGGGGAYDTPDIVFCDLYVNYIYTLPEIMNLFLKKFSFNIIKVHLHQNQTLSKDGSDGILLNNLKYPIETLYLGFRPRANLTNSQTWYRNSVITSNKIQATVVAKNPSTEISGTITSAQDLTDSSGNNFGFAFLNSGLLSAVDNTYNGYNFIITGGAGYNDDDISTNRYEIFDYNGTNKSIVLTGGWNNGIPNATTTFSLFTQQLAVNKITYNTEVNPIQTIGLKAHDIDLFKETEASFFSEYLPFNFKNSNLNMPRDKGWYMLNFNLYPGLTDVSGSVNFSIIREIYLFFKSDYISSTKKLDLIILGTGINFLLLKDGQVVLRYAT